MKTTFLILAINLTSITCAVAAAYLWSNDKQGWDWFLLVTMLTFTWIKKGAITK